MKSTGPMRLERGTVPHVRESHELARSSPMKKYRPFGTCHVPDMWSRRLGVTYESFSFLPLTQMKPFRSTIVSPGSPIKRFTNVPPIPHASLGAVKTTTWPRDG